MKGQEISFLLRCLADEMLVLSLPVSKNWAESQKAVSALQIQYSGPSF